MKRLTRQQAIHWTNLFMNSITPDDAKSILCGLIGIPSIEGANRWLWSQGIGGWYLDDGCQMFCIDAARLQLVTKALEAFKN